MIGWLDCSSGASGDMLLGAVLDAGAPLDVVVSAVLAVAPEATRIQPQRTIENRLERFHLGSEKQSAPIADVKQGADSQSVSNQQQALSCVIPQRDRELSIEVLYESIPVCFVRVDYGFSVR